MIAVMKNPVGRPRGFDEEEVLAAAMDVFWRKGYDGTSMADLMAATGLHKGSIYQAFGDKHSLYIRALRTYVSNMGAKMSRIVSEAGSAVEGLRAAMHHHICFGATDDGGNSGCLALNSLVEDAQNDAEVMEVLEATYKFRMNLITQTVERAQAEGGLRADRPAERIAHLIAATEAGVMVELKGMLDEDGARAIVGELLRSLGWRG